MSQLEVMITNLNINLSIANAMLQDIPDDRMTQEAIPTVNHPAWQAGHLVSTLSGMAQMIGADYQCPPAYKELFGQGSVCSYNNPEKYPDKATLTTEMEKGITALTAAIPNNVTEELLASDTPNDELRKMFPSTGEFLAFLTSGHFTFHMGQLSAWRRAIGLGSALGR